MDGLKDIPKCPVELEYLWDLYKEIKQGCENITYVDINAFDNLTGSGINYFESIALIEIDKIRRLSG